MDNKKIINITLTALIILLLVFIVVRIKDSRANLDDGKIPVDIIDGEREEDDDEEDEGDVPLTYENDTSYISPVINSIPSISLIGDEELTVEINDEAGYTDLGVTAIDSYYGNITDSVVIVNPVDITILGDYNITYNVTNAAGNKAKEVTRIVHVVDTIAPVIEAETESTVLEASKDRIFSFDDLNINISDNSLEDINPDIKYYFTPNNNNNNSNAPLLTVDLGEVEQEDDDFGSEVDGVDLSLLGIYYLVINAKDSSGNEASEFIFTVEIKDQTSPTIVFSREGSDINDNGTGSVTVEVSDFSETSNHYIFIESNEENDNVEPLPPINNLLPENGIISLKDFGTYEELKNKNFQLVVQSIDIFGNIEIKKSSSYFTLDEEKEANFSITDPLNELVYTEDGVSFKNTISGFIESDLKSILVEYYNGTDIIIKRFVDLNNELTINTTNILISTNLDVVTFDENTEIISPIGLSIDKKINSVKLIVTTYNNGIYEKESSFAESDIEENYTWKELLLHTINTMEVNSNSHEELTYYTIDFVITSNEGIIKNDITSIIIKLLKDDTLLATNTITSDELDLLKLCLDDELLNEFTTKFNLKTSDPDADLKYDLKIPNELGILEGIPNNVEISIETSTDTITNNVPIEFNDTDKTIIEFETRLIP